MPSKSRPSKGSGARPRSVAAARRSPRKKTPPPAKKPIAKPARPASSRPSSKPAAKAPPPPPPLQVPLPGGRRHVLSLSFVRDGDEFMARLETDSGHITELKNRALDQLLTLVAGELEDLLE